MNAQPKHPTLGGVVWFTAMVAGWATFWTLAAASNATLADLWHGVRELPLLVEAVVWLAVFPFVLALGIWEAGWAAWIRAALVGTCTVAWSIAFSPWRPERWR